MENYVFLITNLANKFGTLFIFTFILSNLKTARALINKKPVSLKDKLVLSVVFGLFGIVGTYLSVEFDGALINTRIIGVATGGILGGPVVGFLAGLIAGLHRYTMPTGLFTQIACTVSVPFEGLVAGLIGLKIKNKKNIWAYAALVGAIGESMRKISVLIFSKPFPMAVELVKNIWMPMVLINSIGLALLFLIIANVNKDRERIGAEQVNLSINIVDKILPYLKGGLHLGNANNVTDTIQEMTDFDAVTITDKNLIIAHSGTTTPRHGVGKPIVTESTHVVLEEGKMLQMNKCSERNCEVKDCMLNSAIITPLKDGEEIVGTMKFYKFPQNSMTEIDRETAWGLSKLISNQIRINRLEENSKLLVEAELKALQAQINPHFLFNSLTVIASLCRTNALKARDLILHLSNHFRNNLTIERDLVTIDVELNHVKSYVEIEKARFEDKLEVVYKIDENLDCLLPPLTLQPLVENAIKHGILTKKEGGKVVIDGEAFRDNVYITIYDNGVGISDEKIATITDDKIRQVESIGLYNVNRRLIGKFGKDYNLDIKSKQGEWTKIIVKIPCLKHNTLWKEVKNESAVS
ncbi:MAG: LytS/YhcK type 5TM receptor domain-containing protein [Bacillota bacterium]|nr:LytS/YhcK type 5TM receptor domain-containing protein [Bacillota bacterium]